MSDKVYKSTRKYHCPFCDAKLPRMELIDHVEKEHEDLIPENYTPTRVVYDSINKTDHGTCMICKKPVYTWNDKTSRYENLCGSKKCREEVRRIALERHIKVYNKPTLLNDPTHQEKMLANRSISGKYKHSDGAIITYTGKYEKAALEFMDKVMNIPSKDIQMPGPILEYEYNGEKHSWITDIYYIPANLIIEVKDGGDNPNNRSMPEYRGKQKAKEIMITELGKFNYLRLTNNDFSQLLEALAEIKYENMDQSEAPKVNFFINESTLLIESSNYVTLSVKEKKDIKDIISSLSQKESDYIGGAFVLKQRIFYNNIEYVDHNPAGFITVIERVKGPYGFIIMAVKDEYRGLGIASKLVSNMMDYMKKSGNLKTITWNVDFDNKASEYLANKFGFKFYKKFKSYNEYDYDLKDYFHEEVGGLPPRNGTNTWVTPYLMTSSFDDVVIGNNADDVVYMRDLDDGIKSMPKKDFFAKYTPNTEVMVCMADKSTIFQNYKSMYSTFTEFLQAIVGYRFRALDELALTPCWRYCNIGEFKLELDMIKTGVIRENEILSGKVKTASMNDTPIKGYVLLSRSTNGYFIHTPKDYYLASNYYDSAEDIPQNVIDTMNDLYDQYKKRVNSDE